MRFYRKRAETLQCWLNFADKNGKLIVPILKSSLLVSKEKVFWSFKIIISLVRNQGVLKAKTDEKYVTRKISYFY